MLSLELHMRQHVGVIMNSTISQDKNLITIFMLQLPRILMLL